MKITDVTAAGSVTKLVVVPEHPAEIALIQLMNGCEARCEVKEVPISPMANVAQGVPAPTYQLEISTTVKTGSRY